MLTLKEEFESQATFRREKAVQYPDDSRNLEAAELFDSLAAGAESLGEADLLLFDSLRADAVAGLEHNERWCEMLTEIGFHRWPNSAKALVDAFVAERIIVRQAIG